MSNTNSENGGGERPQEKPQFITDDKGQRWFVYRQGMVGEDIPSVVTHVLVEDGVRHIERCAFDNEGWVQHDNIRHVKIARSVESIDEWSFDWCTNLVMLEIPSDSQLMTIGAGAFRHCGVKEIFLPKTLQVIQNIAFIYCDHLSSLTIPAGIRRIGRNAFGACEALEEVSFESFSTIGAMMQLRRENLCFFFNGCTSLHTIKWPAMSLESPYIPPALWPRLLFALFVNDGGLLGSGLKKNRRSCVFSFLCSNQYELLAHPQQDSSRLRRSGRRRRAVVRLGIDDPNDNSQTSRCRNNKHPRNLH